MQPGTGTSTTVRQGRPCRARAWLEILLVMLLVEFSGVAALLVAQAFAGRLPAALLLVPQGLLILGGLHLLLVRAGERWSDLGLRAMQWRDVHRAALLLGACVAANLLLMVLISVAAPVPVLEHTRHLQAIAVRLAGGLPVALIAGLMLFVGVYEELVARGFLLSRCRTALDGVWAPVLLSSVLFGLGHFYQGWIGVLQTTLIGLLLAGYTLRWGTLWPAILAHGGLNTLTVALLEGLGS